MDLDVFGGGVETLKKNGYKILEDVSFHKYPHSFLESQEWKLEIRTKQNILTQCRDSKNLKN